ncbi:hypothetical protein PSCICG_15380 [Pseudomonas cichorii]|nr:hypothetical protein PSCICG_15380 [Pseudomonas cichorii]
MHVVRQLAAVRIEDLAQHMAARATAADADLRRASDELRVHRCSGQPGIAGLV